MKTMAWTFMNGLSVSIHSDVPPTDEEWDTQIAECVARAEKHELRGGFVMTEGRGAPNALQRARISDQPDLQKLPVAIVTRSRFVRGVVTALSWLGKEMAAFPPAEINRAFSYLQITDPDEQAGIRQAVVRLRRELLGMSTKVSAEIPADDMLITAMPDIRERMARIRRELGET